jgi:hypothetical protein
MVDFDVDKPYWVTPEFAASRIQDAWIAQYAGAAWYSKLIIYGTQGVHSHSAMFRRNSDRTIDLLEMLAIGGGSISSYVWKVYKTSGRLDVFAPNAGNHWPEFKAQEVVAAMRTLCDYRYGYAGIFRMAVKRIPLLWRLYPPTTDDRLPAGGKPIRQPFCSHAVSLATHLGGGVDPVPNCPHCLVTPQMLTQSLFYDYQFTIVTPWARRHYTADILEIAKVNEQVSRST